MRRKEEQKRLNGNGNGRVKFRYADEGRYLDIEMEGATDALADGLKSLATALSRGTVVPAPARLASAKAPAATAAVGPAEHESQETESQEDLFVRPEQEGEDEIETPSTDGRQRRKSTPRAPKFLSDLALTSAAVKLADFIAQKKPEEMLERYTVIAEWFKEQFNTPEISQDHIFTAFKHLGWQAQLPPDVSQPLRDLKSKKHWFDKGSARGMYKINWNGTNAVNKMGTVAA